MSETVKEDAVFCYFSNSCQWIQLLWLWPEFTLDIFTSPCFPLWCVDFPEIKKFAMITQRFSFREKPEQSSLDITDIIFLFSSRPFTSYRGWFKVFSFQHTFFLTWHQSVKTLHAPLFIYMLLSNSTAMNLTSKPRTLDTHLRISSYPEIIYPDMLPWGQWS